MIRIAAEIAPQYVSIFTSFLETLFIDGIGSRDKVYYVSIKILEIPLGFVFLEEVDTYRGSDSAAIRVNSYKGPLCSIEKKFSRNTLY